MMRWKKRYNNLKQEHEAMRQQLNKWLDRRAVQVEGYERGLLAILDRHVASMTPPSHSSSALNPMNFEEAVRFHCDECNHPWPCPIFRDIDALIRLTNDSADETGEWQPLELKRADSEPSDKPHALYEFNMSDGRKLTEEEIAALRQRIIDSRNQPSSVVYLPPDES